MTHFPPQHSKTNRRMFDLPTNKLNSSEKFMDYVRRRTQFMDAYRSGRVAFGGIPQLINWRHL